MADPIRAHPDRYRLRTVLGTCFVAAERTVRLVDEPYVDWSSLSHAREGSSDEPRGPTSPTAMVEVVLDVLAGVLLEGELPGLRELPAAQSVSLEWVDLAGDRRLGLLLRRSVREVRGFRDGPVGTAPEGFNLVVAVRA